MESRYKHGPSDPESSLLSAIQDLHTLGMYTGHGSREDSKDGVLGFKIPSKLRLEGRTDGSVG